MTCCNDIYDWTDEGEGVFYSPSTNISSKSFGSTFMGLHAVHIFSQRGQNYVSTIMTSLTVSDLKLADVPTKLWAKHKYDVGLMKNAAPLIVKPKSDYRPYRTQYPLNQRLLRE